MLSETDLKSKYSAFLILSDGLQYFAFGEKKISVCNHYDQIMLNLSPFAPENKIQWLLWQYTKFTVFTSQVGARIIDP